MKIVLTKKDKIIFVTENATTYDSGLTFTTLTAYSTAPDNEQEKHNKNSLGYIIYSYNKNENAVINGIKLKDKERNQGIGSALISMAEFDIRNNKCNEISGRFMGDNNARNFYISNGYSFEDTYFYGEFFEKRLNICPFCPKYTIVDNPTSGGEGR